MISGFVSDFIKAAENDNLTIVRMLLNDRLVSIDCRGSSGNTALMSAAREGCLEVTKYLVKHGAALEARSSNKMTALGFACLQSSEHTRIIDFLLDRGADSNTKDYALTTPLHRIAICNNADAATLLLRRGADPYAKNSAGFTPYDLAMQRRNFKVAMLMPQYEAFESLKLASK